MLNPTYITDKLVQTDPVELFEPKPVKKSSKQDSFVKQDSFIEPSMKDLFGMSTEKPDRSDGPRMSMKDMIINKV